MKYHKTELKATLKMEVKEPISNLAPSLGGGGL
jgi:hypothetical protein